MDGKEDLIAELKSCDLKEIAKKYKGQKILFDIFEYCVKTGNLFGLFNIIDAFPVGLNYDSRRLELIDKYNDDLYDAHVRHIFSRISSFKTKFDRVDEMICLISEEDMIEYNEDLFLSDLIYYLRSDSQKIKIFRTYFKYFNSSSFSTYISCLNDDNLKMSEFLACKQYFPEYHLARIAPYFHKKEDIYYFFDTFITEKANPHDDIYDLLKYRLRDDEDKMRFMDKYISFITKPSEIVEIIYSFTDDINKLDRIKMYAKKISKEFNTWGFQQIVTGFKSEDMKIDFVLSFIDYIDADLLTNLVKLNNDYELKIKLLMKKKDNLSFSEIWSVLVYLPSEDKEKFIDKFIYLFDDYAFARLKDFKILSIDRILDKYIDRYDALFFGEVLMSEDLCGYRSFDDKLSFLLSKTKDPHTIKAIYNAVALINPISFKLEIYNNDKEIFTKEERRIINRLFKENKHLFDTFIFSLLDIPYLRNNLFFLRKLSLYPEIASRIVIVSKAEPERFVLLLRLIKLIYSYDINHDIAINNLLDSFNSRCNPFIENVNPKEITNKELKLVLYQLLCRDTYYKVYANKKDNNEYFRFMSSPGMIKNYPVVINKKTDEKFYKTKSLSKLREIVMYKIFGMDSEIAQVLLDTYGVSMDKYQNDPVIDYLKVLRNILNSEDEDELRSIYLSVKPLTFEERYLFEFRLRQTFNKKISDSLFKVDNESFVQEVKYKGNTIPVYSPTGDFYMLVNSICAYSNWKSPTNYYYFWHQNKQSTNHGICCSLISNQSAQQTAPIRDVLLGFDSFDSNAILLSNSYDLVSSNNEYVSTSVRKNRFMDSEDMVNNTRHTHNELVLERKELREHDQNEPNIKPSYVVVYSNFSDAIKRRSKKAAVELNCPIVYLDVEKNRKREETIISEMRLNLLKTYDVETLKKLIVRYENNIHSLNRDFDITHRSNTSMLIYLRHLIHQVTEDSINNKISASHGMMFLVTLINLLRNEREKHEYVYRDFSYKKSEIIDFAKEQLAIITKHMEESFARRMKEIKPVED